MTGTLLLREEVLILMQMDTAFLNAVADEHEDTPSGRKPTSNGGCYGRRSDPWHCR